MANNSTLRLDQQLCFAIYSAALSLSKVYRPWLEPLGLTYPQYLVMLVLWEADGISVKQLGERVGLDSGTLTALLKRLEHSGWIRRQRSLSDARQLQITLSPNGQRLRAKALPIPPNLLSASGCTLAQAHAVRDTLAQLRQRLLQQTHPQERKP